MRSPHEIALPELDPGRLGPIVGDERLERFRRTADEARVRLEGRAVVNVNSTAAGGGVAEMLVTVLGYARASGIDARWLVIEGDPAFFAITKRVHNGLYGGPGDGGPLSGEERTSYETTLAANADGLLATLRPEDVVVLHDPQTAGLVPHLAGRVAALVWRCHVGFDGGNEWVERAWAFVRPYVEGADGLVFSRASFAPSWVDPARLAVIPPSIDPFTPKNVELPNEAVLAVLRSTGLVSPDGRLPAELSLPVETVALTRDGAIPAASEPLVVQVSRWDRMKDMPGVLLAFAEHVDPALGAHLVLAGPSVEGVADDPEGAEVFADTLAVRASLEPAVARRVHLAQIGMGDIVANAHVVNALQRHAAVVVQKSLAEGFGLTVAEALWKRRPVVAGAVGGIVDQISDGVEGLLVEPTDLRTAGEAMQRLLADAELRRRMGERGRERVVEQFLADRHLEQYATLLGGLLGR
jgi:trehalose synthase